MAIGGYVTLGTDEEAGTCVLQLEPITRGTGGQVFFRLTHHAFEAVDAM